MTDLVSDMKAVAGFLRDDGRPTTADVMLKGAAEIERLVDGLKQIKQATNDPKVYSLVIEVLKGG